MGLIPTLLKNWVHPPKCRTIIFLWGGYPACPHKQEVCLHNWDAPKGFTSYLSTPYWRAMLLCFPKCTCSCDRYANSVNCLCSWRDLNTRIRLISSLDFQLVNATLADSFHPKLGIGGSYGSNYRINFRAGI